MEKPYRRARSARILASILSLLLAGCASGTIPSKDEDQIVFTTTGSSFSPQIVVGSESEVLWIFSDGTTSDSTSPSVDFGSAGVRKQKLKVTPWAALTEINVGYDGGDDGTLDSTYYLASQNVSEVANLNLAASSLKIWCSSNNPLTALDFSRCSALETIECYKATSLSSVNLSGCTSLTRACFEDCDLDSLDLSDCSNLEDLRGALNNFTDIDFPDSCPALWHICVRENSQITNRTLFNAESLARFPAIRELYIWSDNQTGALTISSTGSGDVSIQAYENSYTTANFTGALQDKSYAADVDLRNNALTEVIIDGCDQITSLDLSNNQLDSDAVDYILITLDSLGRESGTVDLTGNDPPSSAATDAISSLGAKYWTVEVDSE